MADPKDKDSLSPWTMTEQGMDYHRTSERALRALLQESACAKMMDDLLLETDLEHPLKRNPTLQYLDDKRHGIQYHLDDASHLARTNAEYNLEEFTDLDSPPPMGVPGVAELEAAAGEKHSEHDRQRRADQASLQSINGTMAGRATEMVENFTIQAQPGSEGELSPLLSNLLNRRPETGHPMRNEHGEYDLNNISERKFVEHHNKLYTPQYIGRLAEQEITGAWEKMRLLNRAMLSGGTDPQAIDEVTRLIGEEEANNLHDQVHHILGIYKDLSDGKRPANQSEWIAPSLREKGLTLIPGMTDILPRLQERLEELASQPDENADIESPTHPNKMAAALANTFAMRLMTQAHAARECQELHGPLFLGNDRFLTRMAAGEWEQVEKRLTPPPLPTVGAPKAPQEVELELPPLPGEAVPEEAQSQKMMRKKTPLTKEEEEEEKKKKEKEQPSRLMTAKDKTLGAISQIQQAKNLHEQAVDLHDGKSHAQLVRKHVSENAIEGL